MNEHSETPTNPENSDHFAFEIQVFDAEAEELINKLLSQNKTSYVETGPENERYEHYFALMNVRLVLKEIKRECSAEKSFVVFAKDSSQTIAGLFLAGVSEQNTVPQVFFGVSYEHTRKGLATQLVEQAHLELKKRGLNSYQASFWEGSRKTVEKTGVKMIPDPHHKEYYTIILDNDSSP